MGGSNTRSLVLPIVVFLVVSVLGGAIAYTAGLQSKLHDVASVARMPIPGTKDVELDKRGYGVYFGMSNAPSHKAMHIPKLSITLVPPKGMPDPEFVELPDTYGSDVFVDGFTTVQIARISVTAPGRYHVHVESPDESGGSFSIGELPRGGDPDRARIQAAIVAVIGLVLSGTLFALRRRAA